MYNNIILDIIMETYIDNFKYFNVNIVDNNKQNYNTVFTVV